MEAIEVFGALLFLVSAMGVVVPLMEEDNQSKSSDTKK
jgi:hypothetical protein